MLQKSLRKQEVEESVRDARLNTEEARQYNMERLMRVKHQEKQKEQKNIKQREGMIRKMSVIEGEMLRKLKETNKVQLHLIEELSAKKSIDNLNKDLQ